MNRLDSTLVKMPSRHFYISSIVSVLVAALFFALIAHESNFKLTDEYQLIPEDFILPHGCDIKVDIQTGETWARISNNSAQADNLITVDEKQFKDDKIRAPAYKNITKSRIQARLTPEAQLKLDEALLDLESNDNWEFLLEEAPAMEFGLAVVESKKFSELFKRNPDERSLKLISTCVQNNPLAVERFLEVSNDVAGWLGQLTELNNSQIKLILRIVENVMNNNDKSVSHGEFISKIKHLFKSQLEKHEGLDERHEQVRQALLK